MGAIGIGIAVLGIVFFGWAVWLYQSSTRLLAAVLNRDESTAMRLIGQVQFGWKPASWLITALPATNATLPVKAVSELIPNLDILLGVTTPRSYVILLENNMELRPTGGFMGSYAVVKTHRGVLSSITVEDIYTPDGQIKGYVPEPEAIKKYLFNNEHPGWRLRDANWHPDFVESAKAIEWFLSEGGVSAPDGFGAITLNPLISVLRQTGPLALADYGGLKIDADNFYAEAQNHAEADFFPGSTQKRDFLTSLSKQLLFTITNQPEVTSKLMPVFWRALAHKELLLYIPDVTGPSWRLLGWDGSLRTSQSDYLMINEANVGSTKANCCIVRTLEDRIEPFEDGIHHTLTLWYRNENPAAPQPPYFWGGGYKNYLRIIVPQSSWLATVTINDVLVEPSAIDEEVLKDKKAFGFLVLIQGGESATVQIRYTVPIDAKRYALLFQKQTGIREWPATWITPKEQRGGTILRDELLHFRLQ